MKITRASEADLPEVFEAIESLLSELCNTPYQIAPTELLPLTVEKLQSDEYIVFIARDSDELVGMVTLSRSFAVYAGGYFGIIHEFYVAPKHRSKRLGMQLMNHVKQFSKDKGWKRLEVGAPDQPNWKRTKDFYVREGFCEIGPRLRWIAE